MNDPSPNAPPAAALADPDADFIARAQQFLISFGANPAALDPDVDLVDAGVLDSLLVLAFLAFVEEQGGHEVQLQPEDMVAIRKLRTASMLARSRTPSS